MSTTETTTLSAVRHDTMLINARSLLKRQYRGRILWAMVSDICGTGSNTAIAICKEMKWNPHEMIKP